MNIIKNLLEDKKKLYISILENEKESFLEFAKSNNCEWLDGDEIKPKQHNCGYHMCISKNRKLAFVEMNCWFLNKDSSIKKINYSDINILLKEKENK